MKTPLAVPYATILACGFAAFALAVAVLTADDVFAPSAHASDAAWMTVWVAYGLAGAVVVDRRGARWVGAVFVTAGALPALALMADLAGVPTVGRLAYDLLLVLVLVGLPAVFPSGPRGGRWRSGVVVGGTIALGVTWAGTAWEHDAVQVIGRGMLFVAAGAAVTAIAVALRTTDALERIQYRCFLVGVGTTIVVLAGAIALSAIGAHAEGGDLLLHAALLCPPIAVTIAMVAGGLWDTDRGIARRIVSDGAAGAAGVLTALLIAVTALSLATPVMAVVVATIGGAACSLGAVRLGRLLRRRLYGTRSAAFEGLTEFADRSAAEAALAQVVGDALRAPHACIGDDATGPAGSLAFPVGTGRWLLVPPRVAGEAYTRDDRAAAQQLAERAKEMLHIADLRRDVASGWRSLDQLRPSEQRRLRAELHDNLGPLLVGAEMQAHALESHLSSAAPTTRAQAAELRAALAEARRAMRAVIDEADPRALAEGLAAALARRAERWPGLDVHLHLAFDPEPPPDLAAAVYLIVGEALANAAQHAAAATCRVSVARSGDRLHVTVTDDGVGMAATTPKGVGISSILARADALGGSAQIEADPRGGTTVMADLPWNDSVREDTDATPSH